MKSTSIFARSWPALILSTVFSFFSANAQTGQRTLTGSLLADEVSDDNTPQAVNLTLSPASSAGIQIGQGASDRGDYFVNFPGEDDPSQGLLFSSVASHSPKFTSQIAITSTGRYFIPLHDMEMGEKNGDVSLGWFRYDEWLAAMTGKEGNSLVLTRKSSAINQGTHFTDSGTGASLVDLRSEGGSSDAGILLVNHVGNSGEFATSQALPDGRFAIYCVDPRNAPFDYVSEPVSFVYLPASAVGTKGLAALGRVNGNATSDLSGGFYQVTRGDNFLWHLEIFTDTSLTTKHTPESGNLLINSEGNESRNVDNRVAAEWNEAAQRWEIESYDVNGDVIQDIIGTERVFSFAFFESPRANLRFDTNSRTLSVYREGGFEEVSGVFRESMPFEVSTQEGLVTFTFGQDFILEATDRVMCVGEAPLSIVAARDLIIPSGAVIDASAQGILASPGGGLGGNGGGGGEGGNGGRESQAGGGSGGSGGGGGDNSNSNGRDGIDGIRGGTEVGRTGDAGTIGTDGLAGYGTTSGGGDSEEVEAGVRGMGGLSGGGGGGGGGGNGGRGSNGQNGSNGNDGADGNTGGAGGTGGTGGVGAPGSHVGSGIGLIGGAGGSGGRGGSGGGGGASGRGGGGGGGGGGEAENAFGGNGTSGGSGANGGSGASRRQRWQRHRRRKGRRRWRRVFAHRLSLAGSPWLSTGHRR
jgi:hypothetical protein